MFVGVALGAAVTLGVAAKASASPLWTRAGSARPLNVSEQLYVPGKYLGAFRFWAHEGRNELVTVTDMDDDGWSMLVEMWINGKLARTFWDTNGAGPGPVYHNQQYKLNLPEGTRVDVFIAQAKSESCAQEHPSRHCTKIRWAGPFRGTA